MSYRNKLILIAVIFFILGVRVGDTGVDQIVVSAAVDSFEKLTGQSRVLGLF